MSSIQNIRARSVFWKNTLKIVLNNQPNDLMVIFIEFVLVELA
jgi:hypothetical protein